MNEQQRETLRNLRYAAEQDQWNVCADNIRILLLDVKQIDAIYIIVRQAQRFLSDLSLYHPDDAELDASPETLSGITSLEMLDQQRRLLDTLLKKYPQWPGVSNFRNALKGISRPEQYFDHSGAYIDTVVSLILDILMARGVNLGWGHNPEFSRIFFGPDKRKAIFMLAARHSEPKQIELRKSLWTEIAEALGAALQAG
jgi:hypothetical protein